MFSLRLRRLFYVFFYLRVFALHKHVLNADATLSSINFTRFNSCLHFNAIAFYELYFIKVYRWPKFTAPFLSPEADEKQY